MLLILFVIWRGFFKKKKMQSPSLHHTYIFFLKKKVIQALGA